MLLLYSFFNKYIFIASLILLSDNSLSVILYIENLSKEIYSNILELLVNIKWQLSLDNLLIVFNKDIISLEFK